MKLWHGNGAVSESSVSKIVTAIGRAEPSSGRGRGLRDLGAGRHLSSGSGLRVIPPDVVSRSSRTGGKGASRWKNSAAWRRKKIGRAEVSAIGSGLGEIS